MNAIFTGDKHALRTLDEVIDYTLTTLKNHPERDISVACEAALKGERRRHPVISVNHLGDPRDTFEPIGEYELPDVEISDDKQRGIAEEIVNMMAPLKMLNPINLAFSTGKGPGTLVTCFDIPLDPEAHDTPAYSKTIDEVLSSPIPHHKTSGLLKNVYEKIRIVKDSTPDNFKIRRPDTQGPFNIAHSLVGDEAMLAPYTEPDKFHRLMSLITDFWIDVVSSLIDEIGPDRLAVEERNVRIAECSVNLVSRETYEEFILPYDLKINDAFGPLSIHTCSGPHVFYATLEDIPGIMRTEAGFIARTAAGYTPVDEALKAIKGKPILLGIGQELPEGKEYETIRDDFDRYKEHPRMLFNYTGMSWTKKDRPKIREIHQRLDEYWKQEIGS